MSADRPGLSRARSRRLPWLVGLLLAAAPLRAVQRFPQPQFETGHIVPVAGHPAVLQLVPAWVDALMLPVALLLAGWCVLARRSRAGIVLLSLVCLAWYGFIRHGCICPIGATQNVAAAVCGAGGMPWLAVLLFAAPLVAALLAGRVFCAAVCPLGALQDLVAAKPVRVPRVLDAVLGLLPAIALAAAVLFAATGTGFPICAGDPFVGFFRRSAPGPMLLAGGLVVLLGIVVARPYCRYFCPYGLLLGWLSRVAWRRARITPTSCVNCRLCGRSCPFDAILPPRPPASERDLPRDRRRLAGLLLLAPVLTVAGALAGRTLAPGLAELHPTVRTQRHLTVSAAGARETFLDAEAFRAQGGDARQLAADAVAVNAEILFGAELAGAFVALVLAARLIALARQPARRDYSIDPARCVSCGRCFNTCPQHRAWLTERGKAGHART